MESNTHQFDIRRNRNVYLLASVTGHLYILVTIPILTRVLSPESFGVYMVLVQVVVLVQSVVLPFFSNALLKYHVEFDEAELSDFIGTMLMAFAGAMCLICLMFVTMHDVALPVLYPNLPDIPDVLMLWVALWLFLTAVKGLFLSVIKVLERPLVTFVYTLTYGLLLIVSILWFVVHEQMGLRGVVISLVLSEAGAMLVPLIFLSSKMSIRFKAAYIRLSWGTWPVALGSMLFILALNVDRWVLSQSVAIEFVGTYGLGVLLANMLGLFVSANASSFSPRLQKIVKQEGHSRGVDEVRNSMVESLNFVGLAAGCLILSADVVAILLGGGTAIAAAYVVSGLALAHLVRNQVNILTQYLLAASRFGLILGMNAVLLLVTTVACFALSHIVGPMAVAYGLFIAFVFNLSILLIGFRELVPMVSVLRLVLFATFVILLESLVGLDRQLDLALLLTKSCEFLLFVALWGRYSLELLQQLFAMVSPNHTNRRI